MLEEIEIELKEDTLEDIINTLSNKLEARPRSIEAGKLLIEEWKDGKLDPLQVIGNFALNCMIEAGLEKVDASIYNLE